MKREIIRIPNAPSSPLYSQAVTVGSTIYVTGVPGIDPKTNKATGPTIQDQTRQVLATCENILACRGREAHGRRRGSGVAGAAGRFRGLNEAYAKFFPTDPPVRSVARLGPDLGELLVSIKMTAVITQ